MGRVDADGIGQRTASALERGLKDVVAVLSRELNEVDGGKPVVTDMWRVSQGVTKQLAHIISKGFGKLEVEGSLMKDPTKTGAGISQYMRTTLV